MPAQQNNSLQSSLLFVSLFFIGAISFTLWTMSRIPDNIMLHINNEWDVMVVGEKDVNAMRFHATHFKLEKKTNGGLWLTGYGAIEWRHHKIVVRKNIIQFDRQSIAKSRRDRIANIMVYPDGRLSKGRMQ